MRIVAALGGNALLERGEPPESEIQEKHILKAVAALAPLARAHELVITHGKLVYDGSLTGIAERFGNEKLVKLQFEGDDSPADLGKFGDVTSRQGPIVELKVDRARVAEVMAAILQQHTVVDVSIHDPPLDRMIAKVFEEGVGA